MKIEHFRQSKIDPCYLGSRSRVKTMEELYMFRKMKDEGMSIRAIARKYGVSRNTVIKYIDAKNPPCTAEEKS